ncbi:unnamed protein product, partial [Mesorhabditis spiculigera]
MPGLPPVGLGPRIGPFRSEMNSEQKHSVTTLNCANFEDNCRWSNTNEDELDWSMTKDIPNSQSWMSSLGTSEYPEANAGAIISGQRGGWEGGKLISEQLPCFPTDLVLGITAWKSKIGDPNSQPKLQICSKNVAETRAVLANCLDIPIHNGAPIQIDVPQPNDPSQPSQIVLAANNFAAVEGGAMFIQDIQLQGTLNCAGDSPKKHPTLIDTFQRDQQSESIQSIASSQLEDINAPNYDDTAPIKAPQPAFSTSNSKTNADRPPRFPSTSSNSLFEQCLALSCNPSDLSCQFWRSSGDNKWEIGSTGRVSNPLTGINTAPGNSEKYLVAPFLDSHIHSYTLVTEKINIPLTEEVYFCFYEYLTTNGLSLSICTERGDCFYQQNILDLKEAFASQKEGGKRWELKCRKLPVGIYEMRVIAENMGDNKGEIGFLPVRLSKDSRGQEFIC